MSARHQIRIKNQQGVQVALITDESPAFISFYCTHAKNTPGMCRLEVDGSMASLFEPDGQIELLRRVPEFGITEWYTEWEGFHVTPQKQQLEDGTKRFISFGVEYLDLVRREEMGYYAGSAYTSKIGLGETVIKEFVDENIGPGAVSVDRIDVGTMPGLTIQTDYERGTLWDGARAWKPLMQNIQEVAQATGLAFNIVGTGPATFEFRVYEGQQGADRSRVGLDLSTGRNAAGNVPVHFSVALGNMITPLIQDNSGDVINVVYVLGQGEEILRQIEIVKNEFSIQLSPWNRRVESRNAVQETTSAGLISVGEAVLAERKPQKVLSFKPVQTASTVYGKDYYFGDLISAEYDDEFFTLEIKFLEITVNESGEDLRLTFAT